MQMEDRLLSVLLSLIGAQGVSVSLLAAARGQRPLQTGGEQEAMGWVRKCADAVREGKSGGSGERIYAVMMMETAFEDCVSEGLPGVQVCRRACAFEEDMQNANHVGRAHLAGSEEYAAPVERLLVVYG